MTKKELRELIRSTIKEFTGTGASGGNAGDGNEIPSQRIGGSFKTDEEEIEFYSGQNAYKGGKATSGMEPVQKIGNPNRSRFPKF
jgi:hypothetical protein|tara:strand:- start:442 stop:696 length:255 start_codon:yes stop_codon:yes gene_type:complete